MFMSNAIPSKKKKGFYLLFSSKSLGSIQLQRLQVGPGLCTTSLQVTGMKEQRMTHLKKSTPFPYSVSSHCGYAAGLNTRNL